MELEEKITLSHRDTIEDRAVKIAQTLRLKRNSDVKTIANVLTEYERIDQIAVCDFLNT